jgi:hypothetical protein
MGKLKSLKKPKTIVPIVITFLVIVVIISVVHNLNSPANGTITESNYDSISQIKNNSPQKYSDDYISFTYPGTFEQTASEKSPGILSAVNLTIRKHRDEYVAIAVIKEALQSDSGLTYRHQHPDLYKVVSEKPNEVIYEKNDKTEYTGFIVHGNKTTSVSFTSVSPQDMSADYKAITDSLQWKQ